MRFEGKTALVTGASEGIGYAVAKALAVQGANVVLTARRTFPLQSAAVRLGPRVSWVSGDMAEEETARRAVERAVDTHGSLDLLVCNAGILIPGGVADQPLEVVDRLLAVNLRGTIALMSVAAPVLAKSESAAAVLVTSSIARKPAPGLGIYGATKAALHYLVPTWAAELGPLGVRVNAVCAGIVDTPGLRAAAEIVTGLEESVIATNVVKRLGQPEEVAEPILTLLDSAASPYVTGSVWDVDGGYQLGRAG
ncbi:SDR family NAD(P)-dependent oxidoreductase [Nonomuraea typhae]|uniref:SDR family NAD(P)-dependent oxidoreductase n=1 Tax=Nonomuraea typhae TaxID=2603600 RepID=UPI0012FA26D7|nr:SDR family oxidoreductase [Nonomuraea typhae]